MRTWSAGISKKKKKESCQEIPWQIFPKSKTCTHVRVPPRMNSNECIVAKRNNAKHWHKDSILSKSGWLLNRGDITAGTQHANDYHDRHERGFPWCKVRAVPLSRKKVHCILANSEKTDWICESHIHQPLWSTSLNCQSFIKQKRKFKFLLWTISYWRDLSQDSL